MSFFYDLNKKLDSIRATPEVTHQQLNERDMSRAAKGYDKYDEGQDFGPGRQGPNKNQAGPDSINPDFDNYKTPNFDKNRENTKYIDKEMGDGYSEKRWPASYMGAMDYDATGQNKYVDRTTPGVINKIKDKLGLDMPDPAYGPKPDERERLAKRYPAPTKESAGPAAAKPAKPAKPAPAKAGRDGKALDPIRAKYDKYDNDQLDELSQPLLQRASNVAMNKFNTHNINANKAKDPAAKNSEFDQADAYVNQANRIDAGAAKRKGMKKGTEYVRTGSNQKDPNAGSIKDRRMPHGMEESGGPAAQAKPSKPAAQAPAKPSNSAPKGNSMGTIKGGVWTADPPKPGERGVPAPSGDPEGVKEGSKKLNFADKIANAKKEVDEMLGDVAAEAMRSALSPKQKKIDMNKNGKLDANDFAMLRKGAKPEMDEERSKGTAFDPDTPRASTPRVGSIERGAKHDIKHTATGRMVTRRTDAQGISVGGETDDEGNKKEKRTKAGRPDGTGKKIGAKGPSGNSKLMTKVDEVDIRDQGEYDQEGDMAKNDIKTIMRHAQALSKVLGDNDNLPEWVQSKLAKIEGMMISIDEYMQNQEDEEEPIAEKAVSKKQQRFMGMVHSAQKGEKPASKAVGKVANTMKPKDTADFAKTKHKGLPEKKKKEVDENSEDGRLTVKQTGPGQTSTSSSTGRISATVDKGTVTVKPAKSGGISYGQGIYDSMNHELELMIAESMSINMSDSTEGNKSLTITATDEDAMKLAMMLKAAGLGGHSDDMHSHGEEACDTCGMQDCGCGDVQEAVDDNAPDYPTNTEQADNNFGYSGGLNKPKADVAGNGQSTVPVVATRPHNEDDDMRRMMEMAGIKQAELEPWEQTMKEDAAEEQLSEIGDTPAGRAVLQKYQDKAGNQVDAHWQQVHDKSHLPTDPKMAKRNAGTVAAGNRIHGFGIAKNQQDKVTGRFKYRDAVGLTHVNQKNDPLEQGVAEEEVQEDFLESIQRMREIAGIKTEDPIDLGPASPEVTRMSRDEVNAALRSGMSPEVDLGPASPEVTRMSRDEVNAALRSGMSPEVDLGPASPEVTRMSRDEVNAALRSGMSPDMSNMDPDSINAEFYKDDSQYEDSMQRMREMAGIREAKKDIDQDGDGDNDFNDIKIARMKASGAMKDKEEKKKDKEEKKVDESIFALNNQWQAYKG